MKYSEVLSIDMTWSSDLLFCGNNLTLDTNEKKVSET